MQKVIFVIGANAAGKTYFIEHHLASESTLQNAFRTEVQ